MHNENINFVIIIKLWGGSGLVMQYAFSTCHSLFSASSAAAVTVIIPGDDIIPGDEVIPSSTFLPSETSDSSPGLQYDGPQQTSQGPFAF